ncbi:Uncharacterised protein [Vibrio cholerae]|nr:Uncharacterised protein [Vibrio cholerae]
MARTLLVSIVLSEPPLPPIMFWLLAPIASTTAPERIAN